MKTNVLLGLIAIGLVATAVSAATGAYFSDTETSTDNSMEAGVLNLKFNDCDGCSGTQVVNIVDMKPSYDKYSDDIVFRINDNDGKLYKMLVVEDNMCLTNEVTEPERLEEVDQYGNPCPRNNIYTEMWFDLAILNEAGSWDTIIPDETVSIVDIKDKWIYLGTFPPFEDITVRQSFHLWSTVTNWAQGDMCLLEEKFLLYQDNAPHPEDCWNPYTTDHVCMD